MISDRFKYEVTNGNTRGYFYVYQSINGNIYIKIGNYFTPLTLKQIDDLGIVLYEIENYNRDSFKKAYSI